MKHRDAILIGLYWALIGWSAFCALAAVSMLAAAFSMDADWLAHGHVAKGFDHTLLNLAAVAKMTLVFWLEIWLAPALPMIGAWLLVRSKGAS